MRATTVKVEGELLKELERIKPARQSLAAYVRTVLEREIQRQKMAEAGQRYADFVRESPEESAWLEEWDRADLAAPPVRRRR
jgi:hypothetical protein